LSRGKYAYWIEMLVYHRTYRASKIVRDGFRDDTWTRPGLGRKRGVFISPDWLDEHEGVDGDDVLELDIDEALFAQHEWLAKDRTYREAMIPARELNRYPVRLLNHREIDKLRQRRFG
jgi:hypothetical protein